ncbi:isopentenyl-diphosphate Delta-isomerase [Rugosimonospora africana]|uniref:Isopentenyl-diphosphate Delta-isomerase n=1 Tax=Rugosimonospora africana TaxID=556532 RepID=A0A8J3VNN7_9ACTN|nr:isopentenyl-diphosphate Delta-isomerase [Rugosimonospora africana]GIH13389.1 isopentenyl-diphosphate Delta-isomerase [Rugosimonospora africana]
MNRESHLVELVGDDGVHVGQSTVEDAHQAPHGRLHRAFSVLLMDPDGRLLLQQRATVKTRFPLRWANACCGHPAPGVPVPEAAAVRLDEELGITGVPFEQLGVHLYRAVDPATGRVEHEYDHVLLGRVRPDVAMRPDPAEVAQVDWVEADALRSGLVTDPTRYAPWLAGVVALLPDDAGDR